MALPLAKISLCKIEKKIFKITGNVQMAIPRKITNPKEFPELNHGDLNQVCTSIHEADKQLR